MFGSETAIHMIKNNATLTVEHVGGRAMLWGSFSSDGAEVLISMDEATNISQFSPRNTRLSVSMLRFKTFLFFWFFVSTNAHRNSNGMTSPKDPLRLWTGHVLASSDKSRALFRGSCMFTGCGMLMDPTKDSWMLN